MRIASAVAVMLFVAGCGGAEVDEDVTADDATAAYTYKCPGMHRYVAGNDVPADFWLSIRKTKAREAGSTAALKSATDVAFDTGWSINSGGRDYVRYSGDLNGYIDEVRVEPALRTGGYALHNGSRGGYAKIIHRSGEGYDSWTGICFRQ